MDLRERIEIVKSLLDVAEDELLRFLIIPRTTSEIIAHFGLDGFRLTQILILENKVIEKQINRESKYVVNYAFFNDHDIDEEELTRKIIQIIRAMRGDDE